MKLIIVIFLSVLSMSAFSQSKELINAQDYYKAYVKEGRESDIVRAYDLVEQAKLKKENQESDEANFLIAVITKQYYEAKKPESKSDLILQTSKSLLKSYQLNKDYRNKDKLLRLMQIIGYDLYSEGIQVYKAQKNELSYTLYKDLLKIQDVLKQNNLDFSIVSNSGEKSSLATSDIMNNFSIFAMNSGKKNEAKSIFESEVKRSPTALSYTKLVQICNQIGDIESARKYTTEGITSFPNNENLLIYSINMNLNESNIDKALIQIDKAISIKPSIKLFLVKSQTLEKKERYDESIQNYRKALDMYPDDFDLNYGFGSTLFNSSLMKLNDQTDESTKVASERIEEAKKYFEKAKQIDSTKIDFDKLYKQVNSVNY